MDLKLLALCISVVYVFTSATAQKIECYKCELTIVDGEENGHEYCEKGEDAKSKDKTKMCEKGCSKTVYDIELENNAGDTKDIEFFQRGCNDGSKKDKCEMASNSQEAQLEAIFNNTIPGYTARVRSAELCLCDTVKCNSAPSGQFMNHGILVAAILFFFLMKKFL